MEDWIETTLGDEFKIVMGQSPSSKYYNESENGLPFFQGKKEFGEVYPLIKTWSSEVTKEADKGDVLLSIRAPIGPANIAPVYCGIGRGLAAIKPNPKASTKFILYLIQAKENELKKRGSGVTFSAITKPNLFSLPIKIPWLKEECDLIVEEIETQFTRLDSAIKTLNAIKKKLDVYRKSVLKAAFEGNLIKLIGGLVKKALSEEFEIIMGQSPESKYYNKSGEGLPFFQGKKEFSKIYPAIETWSTKASKIADKEDVLLSIRAPIGPVNIAPSRCGIGRGLAAIKRNEKTKPKLIFYLLQIYENELNRRGTGTTFKAITKPYLYSLPITVPKIKEDRELILQEIESRFSVIDKLEQTVDKALLKSNQLRKSILKSAFEGKLVKYDGDNNG